jgi:pimeloyl-ACP methyl ester carboxylesterase
MDKNGTFSPSEGEIKTHLQHRLRLKVKIWRILLGMVLFTASCGILLTAIGTFSTEFTIEEVSYTTEISYNRGVANRDLLFDNVSILPDDHEIITISAYIIRPSNPKSALLPGIVFQHGMVLNKEINLHNAIELACAGFVVLAPDLPGHGNSGGLWDLGMIEMQSLWSGVEYLARLEGVDPDKISLVGHSNGGIASTRAGIFDKTPFGTGGKIKAVVVFSCILPTKWAINTLNKLIWRKLG